MKCRSVGCGVESPDSDVDRLFCERCGWPLASGHVSHMPDTVNLRGSTPTPFQLRIDNEGGGRLRWDVVDLPPGVRLLDDPQEVATKTHSTSHIEVDPTTIDSREIALKVRLWDKTGVGHSDVRLVPLEQSYREVEELVRLQRQRHGPVRVPWKTVLFGTATQATPIVVTNEGETLVNVTATVTDGYEIYAMGQPRTREIRTQVAGGTDWTVNVCVQSGGAPRREGRLRLEADALPPIEVDLLPVTLSGNRPPAENYLVALDFGTSKSAVMVMDQHTRGAEPELIKWTHDQKDEDWVPSVVALDPHDQANRFGWEVQQTEYGKHIIRGMKTLLLDGDPRVERAVKYFITKLLERTDAQFKAKGIDVFASCRIVVTLPVLDNGPQFDLQREQTVKLVSEAARRFGIDSTAVETCKEPECAAIDFLHDLQTRMRNDPGGKMIQPGEWVCVLDMGGGTTDVTFAKVDLETDGSPTFSEMDSVGYPIAGDRIDLELYRCCIDQWLQKKRVKSVPDKTPVDQLTSDKISELPAFKLDGEKLEVVRGESLAAMSVLKESMYRQAPPSVKSWDAFSKQENFVNLAPEKVAPVLRKLAMQMFLMGVAAPERATDAWVASTGRPATTPSQASAPTNETWPSVRRLLEQLELTASQVRYLCLTGGTSLIPDFERLLREYVLIDNGTLPLVTRDSIRLNVVRGAARRSTMKIKGRLPYEIGIAFGSTVKTALGVGTVPGVQSSVREFFDCGERRTVSLVAMLPDRPMITLFTVEVTHPAQQDEGDYLEAEVSYNAMRFLRLRVAWRIKDTADVLPWTNLQCFPAV